MAVQKAGTGAIGRRRIVPMLGIDFIAGQIKRKRKLTNVALQRYGFNQPSMGGRTRSWSTINFLNIEVPGFNRNKTSDELARQEQFRIAVKSAQATIMSPSSLQPIQIDIANNTPRMGKYYSDYATLRGWVMAVRWAQISAGQEITETTTAWTF